MLQFAACNCELRRAFISRCAVRVSRLAINLTIQATVKGDQRVDERRLTSDWLRFQFSLLLLLLVFFLSPFIFNYNHRFFSWNSCQCIAWPNLRLISRYSSDCKKSDNCTDKKKLKFKKFNTSNYFFMSFFFICLVFFNDNRWFSFKTFVSVLHSVICS